MTFKAAILVESRKPLEIADIETPELDFGQVLVRVHYSGICGSQLGEIDAVKGPDAYLPHLLGHEGGGIVESVGPRVSRVKPGDHVVLHWRPAGGIQSATPKYRWGSKTVNAGWVTTFNEYAVVSENRLTAIPKHIDLAVAALYGCALTTGFGVIAHDARLKLGESVVVLGAGGMGLPAVLGASLGGANPIVAVDLHEHKLALAKRFGATHTVCAAGRAVADVRADIMKVIDKRGADIVAENTGVPALIELAYQLAAPKGRVVLVGVQQHGTSVALDTMPLHFGKVLTGSHGGGAVPDEDIPRYLRLQDAGKFDPSPMISRRIKLEHINDGIAAMREGRDLRCIVEMKP